MSSPNSGGRNLLWLYRRLLRSAANYPSKNQIGIFQSIREDFRENASLDPSDPKAKRQIEVAYNGLNQLRQYDKSNLAKTKNSATWSVLLNQNPMPAPADFERKRK
jgi:Complex 1 protein (LYR family)